MIFFSNKQYATLVQQNEALQNMVNAQQGTLDALTLQLTGFAAQLGTIQGLVAPTPLDFTGAQLAANNLGTAIGAIALQATPPAAAPTPAPTPITGAPTPITGAPTPIAGNLAGAQGTPIAGNLAAAQGLSKS